MLPAFYLRIYLVNDNLSLHWTPEIRAWAELHNVELVPTPTSASHLNRIECQFRRSLMGWGRRVRCGK